MTKSRQTLIEENVDFVLKQLNHWLKKNPKFHYLHDDLLSHGHLRLIDVVDRFRKGKVNNLRGYLRLSLLCGFWDAVREETRVRKLSDQRRLYDRKIKNDWSKGGLRRGYFDHLVREGYCTSPPEYPHEEVIEALSEACVDDLDSLLVSMLKITRVPAKARKNADEYKLEELEVTPIARELGMTPLEVQERAGQILARFRRIFYEQRPNLNNL